MLKLFANGEPKPVITDPGNELMLKMMRATLGEGGLVGAVANKHRIDKTAPVYGPDRVATASFE